MISAILCVTPHGKRIKAIDRNLAEQMVADGRARQVSQSLYEEQVYVTRDLTAAPARRPRGRPRKAPPT
jgi:hypothetical protein